MPGVDSSYSWWRLVASVTLSTVGGVGMWCLVVALPALQHDLGVSRADISFAYTMNTLGFFAGGEIAHQQLYGYTGVLTVFTMPAA